MQQQIASLREQIHEQRPLVHHITNFVVMNDTANVTLQLGALPVMAHALEEVADMTNLASVLLLNIGTLTPAWIESMLRAGRRANERGIPIVLDPVGAGATPLRTESALQLLGELDVAVVRGNLGELSVLAGLGGEVKGVESVGGGNARAVAETLARRQGTVAAVTGKRDIISDGERTLAVDNGHSWLSTITGTGCMATTAVAAFVAVGDDPLVSAAAGLACFGLAAERAAEVAQGPGSFKPALLDALYHLTPEQVRAGVAVERL
jgi:hydroxyethylthiazole kinase